MSFASDIALHPDGAGRYVGAVVDGWDIAGNANGGYLAAMAGRAMAHWAERADPISLTIHYLAPANAGPVELEPATIKQGKRLTTVSATLRSAGRPLLAALGTFGDAPSSAGLAAGGPPDDGTLQRVEAEPPELAHPDECIRLAGGEGFPPPLMNRIDLRLKPADAGFASGHPPGNLLVEGWFRLLDGEPLDTTALLLAVDAFPPTAFFGGLPVAWVPTVELTAHIRRRPAPGWLRCRFSTRFVAGGFLEEDGEVWDSSGHLVAQSRQLAMAPRTTN